jgi:hypothetical protein
MKENPLGSTPTYSINWCCKDLQHLLILLSNFKFLCFSGGQRFFNRIQDDIPSKIKTMLITTTLKQCLSFELSCDPCYFRWIIPFKKTLNYSLHLLELQVRRIFLTSVFQERLDAAVVVSSTNLMKDTSEEWSNFSVFIGAAASRGPLARNVITYQASVYQPSATNISQTYSFSENKCSVVRECHTLHSSSSTTGAGSQE